MKEIKDMNARELEFTMIRLRNEYHRRSEEFRGDFAVRWIEKWIDEVQSQGYSLVISNPAIHEKVTIGQHDFVGVERR